MMLNTLKISRTQFDLVLAIITHYDNVTNADEETMARYSKRIYRRGELKAANKVITGHTASPYFIAKNQACQIRKTIKGEDGEKLTKHLGYDLSRFVNFVAKHPYAEEVAAETETAPVKKAKKKVAAKKTAATPKKKRSKAAPEEKPVEEVAAVASN